MKYQLSAAVVSAALIFSLFSCGGTATLEKVTEEQAAAAIEDVFLASGVSLFLLFSVEDPEKKEVASEDGSLVLKWDSLDMESGAGKFTIQFKEFVMEEDNMFASEFNGYMLDGKMEIDSTNPEEPRMKGRIEMSHEKPEEYPVKLVELDVKTAPGMAEGDIPEGSIKVNGHSVDVEQLNEYME
jgi:hypothetical protein